MQDHGDVGGAGERLEEDEDGGEHEERLHLVGIVDGEHDQHERQRRGEVVQHERQVGARVRQIVHVDSDDDGGERQQHADVRRRDGGAGEKRRHIGDALYDESRHGGQRQPSVRNELAALVPVKVVAVHGVVAHQHILQHFGH